MRTLFYNGDILTMESPRPAEAVLIEGRRIMAVGDLSAIAPLAINGTRIVDLQGGALLPGFVDCGYSFLSALRRRLPAAAGGREIRAAIEETWSDYVRHGYTAIGVCGVTSEMMKMFSHAALPYPLWAVADVQETEAVLRAAASSHGRVHLQGVYLDLDVREDGGEATGRLAYCDRAVNYALHAAAAAGLSPVIRAESAAAAEQVIRVARALTRACPAFAATRPVLLDARALSPLAMEKLREVGGIPCFAADVIPRLGDDILVARSSEEAARLTPYAAARRGGLPFTLCGMAGGEIPDPVSLLSAAVCRRTARGILLGENERASVYDALRGLTVHGAWQYHAEHAWGSIRAGMQADLVMMDASPLSLPSAELGSLRCVATWVAGEQVYRDIDDKISTHNERVPSVYESFIK